MRRLFSGWRLMSQRCWRIRIGQTGSRCREQRSGRSILPKFNLVILPPTPCSLLLSRGFTESWLSGLGRKVCCLRSCLLHGGQLDASLGESEEIHTKPPAYMDYFFLPVVSETATDLLPRVALATQVVIKTARENGLRLNMASNKTEAVVDFRGKGRRRMLEELAVEFPVVDGQWTPTVKVADGVSLRLVSTYRHLGTQASSALRISTPWRTRTWRLSGRLPTSGGGLCMLRRARRRCVVGRASSISGRRSACRDCVRLHGW